MVNNVGGGGTHRLGISPRLTTSAATTRERLIPAHTIVPPCSGPSRCGQEMAENVSTPARRPTLTAPARAGVRDVRAGTENELHRGRTENNRKQEDKFRHFRYLEPEPSPLHETGASPISSRTRASNAPAATFPSTKPKVLRAPRIGSATSRHGSSPAWAASSVRMRWLSRLLTCTWRYQPVRTICASPA